MELLGDVLIDRVDREPRPTEAQPLEDRIGIVGLEFADDDVSRTDIDLEADELRPGEARNDDEPEAAAAWAFQGCWGQRDLIAEVIGQVGGEPRGQELRRCSIAASILRSRSSVNRASLGRRSWFA